MKAWAAKYESLPSLGAWIETSSLPSPGGRVASLPSLGAWIETCTSRTHQASARRSLHWERGLKLRAAIMGVHIAPSRSLHWERGLKHRESFHLGAAVCVAPFIGSVD